MSTGMHALFTQTVTGGSTSITNIPQTYTDLKIVVSQRNSSANIAEPLAIRFDSADTIYSNTVLYGDGSSVASSRSSGNAFISYTGGMYINGGTSTANVFGTYEVYVPNYASSSFKQFTIDAVSENNATGAYASLTSGLYRSTAPITVVTIQGYTIGMTSGTTITIYGIRR
jgi:hypothetical protein